MAKKKVQPAEPTTPRPPNVCMMSMWRDDGNRYLGERITHLMSKQGVTRWLWIVGNSSDETEGVLRHIASERDDIEVVLFNSDVLGNDSDSRLTRLSQTANAGLDHVRKDDDYLIIHESDLRSPDDLVPQLLTLQDGNRAVAGMVWLGDDLYRCWYDTWGYTNLDGEMFVNSPPYNKCVDLENAFQVGSAGSVVLLPTKLILDGFRLTWGGMRELSSALRKSGLTIWVNPQVHIIQPTALWQSMSHSSWQG